jgi:integrase/recombinase XerD
MDAFRNFLIASNFRPSSIHLILLSVSRFSEFVEAKGHGHSAHLPNALFEEYLNILTGEIPAGQTIPTYIQQQVWAIGVWTEYLLHSGRISACAFKPITRIRVKAPAFKVLLESEMESLFLNCTSEEEMLLLLLAYGCGLRRNELVALKVCHVHFDSRVISVIHGKGLHHRVVPISERMHYLLYSLLSGRISSPHQFVFMRSGNSRACGVRLARMLKSLCRKGQIEPPLNLHHLRHYYATHLTERGVGILTIQKFLGHQSVSTTTRYTRKRNSIHSL